MIDLSIIIVNYNVQHFVEQTLLSVKAALTDQMEVIVVDNNSKDGSVSMIKEKFPWVKLIENKKNTGFSVANNQGMDIAKGKFFILLNPDTVVGEDSFTNIIKFMDEHDDAGGMGVKMIDGSGEFLAESKRSLPTPEVAFYKMFGLSSIFKKSKRFGKYHLGYLDENENHEVEILAGAYMVLRKELIDKIGGLDEIFFMYGEDIDLSYRIIKAGYKNYYYPDSKIIHYKGESTKSKNLNYIRVFYNAMILFSNKHFTGTKNKIFSKILQIAIYFRAFIALINSYFGALILPVIDFTLLYGGMYYIVDYWEKNHRYIKGGEYPSVFLTTVIPMYLGIWLISIFFSGGNDKPLNIKKTIRGVIIGTIILSIIYSFLNEDWRFSRAIIILGAVWATMSTSALRLLIQFYQTGSIRFDQKIAKRMAVIGDNEEVQKVLNIFSDTNTPTNFIGQIDCKTDHYPYLGESKNLSTIIDDFELEEVIFCSKTISYKSIIQTTEDLKGLVDFKIAPDGAYSIIGSNNSSKSSGELYTIEMQMNINQSFAKRNKRVFDILTSLIFLVISPIIIWFSKKPITTFTQGLYVLFGKRTWVGVDPKGKLDKDIFLPKIKKGILPPYTGKNYDQLDEYKKGHLNFLYLRDYSALKDLKILLHFFPKFN